MFIEARRLGLKYVYVYVIAGIVIAISVAFPLFLAARELRIAALDSNTAAYKLEIVDVITLLIVFAVGLLAAFAIL